MSASSQGDKETSTRKQSSSHVQLDRWKRSEMQGQNTEALKVSGFYIYACEYR